MKKVSLRSLIFLFCLSFYNETTGQIWLEAAGGMVPLDICNCQQGSVIPIGTSAIAVNANNNPVYLSTEEIFEYDLGGGTSTLIGPMLGGGNNLVIAENGLIYSVGVDSGGSDSFLGVLDPATGVFTDLGLLPTGFYSGGDLFFYGGKLYMLGGVGNDYGVIEIPINNPGAAYLLFPFVNLVSSIGAASFYIDGVQTVFISGIDGQGGGPEGLFEFNMATGAYSLVCQTTTIFDIGAWSGLQFQGCCENNAGNF